MFRIGTGFDVHAFEPGNKIFLCGVEIPFDRSLAGHSDADVALHALTDAILGALALGDIGLYFPDTDEKWKEADSVIFLNWSIKKAKFAQLAYLVAGLRRATEEERRKKRLLLSPKVKTLFSTLFQVSQSSGRFTLRLLSNIV